MRCRRLLTTAILAIAAVLPIHGEEKASDKFYGAVALVDDPAEKIRCNRAAVQMEKWVVILKLQNWDIQLNCGAYPPIPAALGITEIHKLELKAKVWINTTMTDRPPEEVVIHELLHLVINDVADVGSGVAQERAVWTLGELLYKGKGCIEK